MAEETKAEELVLNIVEDGETGEEPTEIEIEAASETLWCEIRHSSISAVLNLCPDTLITSSTLPCKYHRSSSSIDAKSP